MYGTKCSLYQVNAVNLSSLVYVLAMLLTVLDVANMLALSILSFCSFSNSYLILEVLKDCAEIFLCQRSLWYNIHCGRTHAIRMLLQPVC